MDLPIQKRDFKSSLVGSAIAMSLERRGNYALNKARLMLLANLVRWLYLWLALALTIMLRMMQIMGCYFISHYGISLGNGCLEGHHRLAFLVKAQPFPGFYFPQIRMRVC
jgi:hypothetical protein